MTASDVRIWRVTFQKKIVIVYAEKLNPDVVQSCVQKLTLKL